LLHNFQTAGDIFVNLQLSIHNFSNIPSCGMGYCCHSDCLVLFRS
jgi:hypothetical protein